MNLSRQTWTLLGAALLVTTCSPEYKSGVTACAEKEPRCPEGFVCSGIRCYLAGEAPDGGTPLGGSPGTDASPGNTGGAPATGGRGGTGGAPMGGTGGRGGMGGTDGPPPPPGGQAVLKFCSNVGNADDTPFEAELVIGQVSVKANTGKCAPVVGQPCVTIPAGRGTVTVRRVIGGAVLLTRNVDITAGVEHIVALTIDDMTNQPEIIGGDLQGIIAGARCSAVDYRDFFSPNSPDAGVPPPARDAGPPPPSDARPIDSGSLTPAPMCASFEPRTECLRCDFSRCCSEWLPCFGPTPDPTCKALFECVDRCQEDDEPCNEMCVRANMAGFQLYRQLIMCADTKCPGLCEDPEPTVLPLKTAVDHSSSTTHVLHSRVKSVYAPLSPERLHWLRTVASDSRALSVP